MLLEIGLILTLATVLAVTLRRLQLPLILGYILTGAVLAGVGGLGGGVGESLELFSSLGIALLLFMVGIELNFKEVKEVGPVSLAVGLGQVAVTSAVGFGLAFFILNFSLISSVYIAVALTFSSTIIIIKLLSEKGDLNSLYGRISVGMLLVQDLVAVLALVLLAGLTQDSTAGLTQNLGGMIGLTFVKVGLLFALAILLTRVVTPWIFEKLISSPELVLMGALSWAILLGLFAEYVGFTLEVGAFLAGLTLAASPYRAEIGAKIKPLRDFFIILFFIYLGTMAFPVDNFSAQLLPAAVFSGFVVIGNPLILLSIMGVMGYHRRVSFLTGLTVAQISEFSLIVVAMGAKLGHLDSAVVSMVTLVGAVTITLSSFLIHHGDRIYDRLQNLLKHFEREELRHHKNLNPKGLKNHAVLYGYGRMGEEFAKKLYGLGVGTVVVDYDPRVLASSPSLEAPRPHFANGAKMQNGVASSLGEAGLAPDRDGLSFLYGDAADLELLPNLGIEDARILISTVPDYETNIFLTQEARRLNEDLIIIARAGNQKQAEELRAVGAGFVVVPEVVAAHAVGRILEEAL